MKSKAKISKHFSGPLMKQNIKSNWILTVVTIIIASMMAIVICFALNMMGRLNSEEKNEAQVEFFSHLSGIAIYNQTPMAIEKLSAEHFIEAQDKSAYETVFDMMNAQSEDFDLSVDAFNNSIEILKDENGSVENYVKQFEYVYAMMDEQGVFTGEQLSIDKMMQTMLTNMGLSADQLEMMAEMDSTAILDKMYFTVMGLLPLLLFIVIVGNSLVVNQVDSGSMAYVLATPTKRSAVANTQAIFLIVSPLIICTVVCITRIAAMNVFMGEPNVLMNIALYGGMYILIEAIGGICYMGSCLFSQSRKATAFGGGIAVWCFIASLLGMFGSKDMVEMGAGVEELAIFNKLTLVGLYDIEAISTVGTDSVAYSFVWKLCVLAGVAIVTYLVGKFRFQKKDLPL